MQVELIKASLTDKYATGVMFAGYYFAQTHPDWTNRLKQMAVYSIGWPITLTLDVLSTINSFL
jgi:hypothetical protein